MTLQPASHSCPACLATLTGLLLPMEPGTAHAWESQSPPLAKQLPGHLAKHPVWRGSLRASSLVSPRGTMVAKSLRPSAPPSENSADF